MINHAVVTPNYFRTMGIPLREGRDFTDGDTDAATKVTVVDERLAQQYWPGKSAVGKRVRFGPPESNEPWFTVIGVAGSVRYDRLDRETRQTVYVPYQQIPIRGMTMALRASGDPESLAGAVRKEVQALDKDQPVTNVLTMDDVISRSVWQPRFYAILFGIFAVLALVLAAVGIYGVMAYAVTNALRRLEFAWRWAPVQSMC